MASAYREGATRPAYEDDDALARAKQEARRKVLVRRIERIEGWMWSKGTFTRTWTSAIDPFDFLMIPVSILVASAVFFAMGALGSIPWSIAAIVRARAERELYGDTFAPATCSKLFLLGAAACAAGSRVAFRSESFAMTVIAAAVLTVAMAFAAITRREWARRSDLFR